MNHLYYIFLAFLLLVSCKSNSNKSGTATENREYKTEAKSNEIETTADYSELETEPLFQDTIVDAAYTFEEAIAGTKAPEEITRQLELIEVYYISIDGKIHKGQVLTNKSISKEIGELFEFMLREGFVIEKAIPVVKYGWSDSLSMEDNNSYSFCYRNISYSKHAQGMAIDINPRFNPLRWKNSDRPNQPSGAVLDTTVNGTLHPRHPVVKEFRRYGYRWGHTFTRYHDDHHFEKVVPLD